MFDESEIHNNLFCRNKFFSTFDDSKKSRGNKARGKMVSLIVF